MTQYLACTKCHTVFSPTSGPSCYGCGEPLLTVVTPDELPTLTENELEELSKRIDKEWGDTK